MAGSHTSRDFESELRELRAHALAMGARCERSLQLALQAFWSGSEKLAAEVKELDKRIDRDEMDIDALVLRILALRQPVAYDLRFLATALKLVTDLERVGDEAVNIAAAMRDRNKPDNRTRTCKVLLTDGAFLMCALLTARIKAIEQLVNPGRLLHDAAVCSCRMSAGARL